MRMRSCALAVMLVIEGIPFLFGQAPISWKIHDLQRPVPPVVEPGTAGTQEAAGRPPSDATVLFDGKPAKWKVQDGYMEVAPGTGELATKDSFGDCQLHVEFSAPTPPTGKSQGRGNSGVFLMGLYEIQVLDSYENRTYADGQAAAVYGQYPPLVNASRKPAEWQTYDIVFRAPHFGEDGVLARKGRVTVFHNGVLVQDNVEIEGSTATP